MINIAVFASGRGSNFRAIHQQLAAMEEPPARIVLCISNNPRPGAFEYAEAHHIPVRRLSPKMFPDNEEEYDRELGLLLSSFQVDLIVLAGYMRKLPRGVVETYRGRILNIHPALLPEFGGKGMYGMNVHQAVIEAGKEESGVTVHLVDEEYDTGAIVGQKRLPVLPHDTPESLAERVLQLEHEFFPEMVIEAARNLSEGREIG